MTVEEMKELNLPIDATEETALYIDAAIQWLKDNTTLDMSGEMPPMAKLFLCKYYEIMSVGGTGIASESIGGMSQSFTTESKTSLLWQLAKELLGAYLKSQVKSVPNVSKWK